MARDKIDIGGAEVDGRFIDSPANTAPADHSYKGKGIECLFDRKDMQAAIVENGKTLVKAKSLEEDSQFVNEFFGVKEKTYSNPENTVTVNPSAGTCISQSVSGLKEIPMKKMSFEFGSP